LHYFFVFFFFFQAEDGIRDFHVTGVQTCALPIYKLQTGRELMQGVLALLFHLGMNPRHPQPLLLAPSTAFLPPCQAALLLAADRSEERRVGKEWGAGWAAEY